MSNRKKPNNPWLAGRAKPGERFGIRHMPRRENRRRKQMRLRAEYVKQLQEK